MGTVTVLTADATNNLFLDTVVSGTVDGSGHLILTKQDASTVDCGSVKGDKGDTGAAGPSGGRPPASAIVVSSTFLNGGYSTDAASFMWACDGTSDEVEINAAIAAVATEGGGSVKLLGTGFSTSDSIVMKTGVKLHGEGLGTIIQAASGFGSGMIVLEDATTHATIVSDLTLDGNSLAVHGFHYSQSGGQVFSTPEPSTQPDPVHKIHNVFICDTGSSTVAGYGMLMQGANLRAGQYTNIRIQRASGCGVWINGSVDSHYANLDVASSASSGLAYSTSSTAPIGHGIYCSAGDNNMFTACKTWYNRGAGFYNRGSRNGYANCQAQDNYSCGFHMAWGKSSYVGCHADSNGSAAGDSGRLTSGFYVASELNRLEGCMSYDRGNSTQTHGVQYTSGSTYCYVGVTTYANTAASTTGTLGTGSTSAVISSGT